MATVDIDFTAGPPATLPGRMTEDEFVAWALASEAWAEWADGEVVVMNAVDPDHGGPFSFLHRLIGDFVEEHELGRVFAEPVMVRLPRQSRRRSPDIFRVGVAKKAQVMRQHFEGAPDLIVELISAESRHRDTVAKFAEYEAAGVPEHWPIGRCGRSRLTHCGRTVGTGGSRS